MKKSIFLILTVLLCATFLCGAACDHSFDDWQIEGDEMRALCTRCYETVTKPVDRQEIAETRLPGKWLTDSLTSALLGFDMTFTFNEDMSFEWSSSIMDTSDEAIIGTWAFESYDEEEVNPTVPSMGVREMYNLTLTQDDGNILSAQLVSTTGWPVHDLTMTIGEGDSALALPLEKEGAPEISQWSVTQEDYESVDAESLLSENLVGLWTASESITQLGSIPLGEDEKLYLNFSADGSVSYTAGDKTIPGTWASVGDATSLMGITMCTLSLDMQDGFVMTIIYSEGGMGQGSYLPTLTYTDGETSYSFMKSTFNMAQLADEGDVANTIAHNLPGEWAATQYTYESGDVEYFDAGIERAVFEADGTLEYTDAEGVTLSGTWAAAVDTFGSVNGDMMTCPVDASLDDGRKFIVLLAYNTAEPEYSFLCFNLDGYQVYFDPAPVE